MQEILDHLRTYRTPRWKLPPSGTALLSRKYRSVSAHVHLAMSEKTLLHLTSPCKRDLAGEPPSSWSWLKASLPVSLGDLHFAGSLIPLDTRSLLFKFLLGLQEEKICTPLMQWMSLFVSATSPRPLIRPPSRNSALVPQTPAPKLCKVAEKNLPNNCREEKQAKDQLP